MTHTPSSVLEREAISGWSMIKEKPPSAPATLVSVAFKVAGFASFTSGIVSALMEIKAVLGLL